MDGAVLFEYQIPFVLFEKAEQPIGTISVRLGLLEIAKTHVNPDGLTSFYLPKEVHRKIQNMELAIRTLHYNPDEGTGKEPLLVNIVCLFIVQLTGRVRDRTLHRLNF